MLPGFNPPWKGPPIGFSPHWGNPAKEPWIDFTKPELYALTEEARTRWRLHYKPGLVEMAVRFSQNWTESTITKSLLWAAVKEQPEEVVVKVVRSVYIKGIEVAGEWIKSMGQGR